MGTKAGLAKWHQTMDAKDPAMLTDLLHEDVVFLSPVVHTAQQGRVRTKLYLTAAMTALATEFRYLRELVTGQDAVLEFECNVDGVYVNGIDMIRFDDDGKIIEFKVMVRPLKAISAVHQAMAAQLEALTKGT